MLNEVLEYFPQKISEEILKSSKKINIEEIRIRAGQKILLKSEKEFVKININITREILQEIFENICEKSIYSYTKQISEGFITIKGGNRVGIVGSAVIENNQVKNLNYISSLNFRISRQIIDVSNSILKYVIDIKNDNIFNTIICSTPGAGKTTILRDLLRKISNRNARNPLFK